MITIRVYRSGGGPLVNKTVKVHSRSGMSKELTDSNGSANFSNLTRGTYTVYVEGRKVYSGPVVDVQIVYI
jgi:hypothetical protein